MEHVTNAVRLFRTTREYLAPVLTQTAFLDRGVLMPEEFVRAGDHLVSCCPSWQWCEGDDTKLRDYLPRNKQFLLSRGVPSRCRVSSLSATDYGNDTVKSDLEGDWEAPSTTNDASKQAVMHPKAEISTSQSVPPENPLEDEYLDMEDDSLCLDDSVVPTSATGSSLNHSTLVSVVKMRRYDISITYDKYYQTPRIWLYGFDENGSPLTPEDIYEDVMQDYAKKTVTVDPHPHLNSYHASIHPCQHGPAMKRILDILVEGGRTPQLDQYLFIFLKFIQGVIPTIEYDYSVDVQIGVAVAAIPRSEQCELSDETSKKDS